MSRRLSILLVLALVAGYLTATAQSQPRSRRSRGGGLNGRFAERSPDIGKTLPDVSAFDADGNPLSLRSLKEHYTVLVLGCLT